MERIHVSTQFQREISNNSWVRPEETVWVESINVIYEDSQSEYPPVDSFSITLFDGIGTDNVTFNEEQPLGISFHSPSSLISFEFYMKIYQIPIDIHSDSTFRLFLHIDPNYFRNIVGNS